MNRRSFLTLGAGLGLSTAFSLPVFAGSPSGSFTGKSGHITTGGVSVSAASVDLAASFDFDGAPDPRVGLGKNGKYDPATDMGALRANKGAQSYAIPAGVDASAYNEVYIFCRKFNVPLGVAPLN